jgi:hypothetical protein
VSNAYVVFGGAAGVNLRLDLLNGTNGFLLTVADPANGVRLGSALSNAGDVNGDGFDDIIVGAKLTDAHGEAEAGVSYVVFGKAGGFGSVINVDELDGTNGFRIEGAQEGDHLGIAVSNAGDVNGDGYDDLLVGTESGGNTYLLFGSGTGFAPTIDLASLSGSQGIRLEGGFTISSVSAAGDVDGDGFDDIMIGASNAVSGTEMTGASYVIFGSTFLNPSVHYVLGTAGDDVLDGAAPGVDVVMGGVGNDELSGNTDDVLNGGAGDDVFHFAGIGSRIVGGSGFDTLKLSGGGLLNLTNLNAVAHYGAITGVEQIDMSDGVGGQLVFTATDLRHLSDEQHQFFILGDTTDQVSIGGGWTAGSNQTIDGTAFKVFTLGVSTLFVEAEIGSVAA